MRSGKKHYQNLNRGVLRQILWAIHVLAYRLEGSEITVLSTLVNFIFSPATMTMFNIPDCTTTGTQAVSFCNKQSDDVFHLSPFAQLHNNTICPIYDINTTRTHACSNVTLGTHCNNSNSEGDCSSIVAPSNGSEDQSCEVSRFYPVKCVIPLITRRYNLKTHSLTLFLPPVVLLKHTFYSKLLAPTGKYGLPDKISSIKSSIAMLLHSSTIASCWRKPKTSFIPLTVLWGRFAPQSGRVVSWQHLSM